MVLTVKGDKIRMDACIELTFVSFMTGAHCVALAVLALIM